MVATHAMSAVESAFLGLESRTVPFVHASILSFDRPIPLDGLRAHVDAALADIPRYHHRIERGRFGAAVWADDASYRIEHHVHAASVAAPGGTQELEDLAAQLLSSGLPAGHSPWRLWTVSGLADGRGAVIALFHHALVDGIAGFRLLEHVLRGRGVEPAPERGTPTPQGAALRELLSWRNVGALTQLLRDGLRPAAQLGINPRRTGAARAVASHTVALDAMKQIGGAFEATTNDVVLATVAGALRRFVIRRGVAPEKLIDVRAMVPVSRHARGASETTGNRVVLLLVRLPLDETDPVACLRRIAATTRELKAGRTSTGGELLVALSEVTSPALLTGVLGLALEMRAFNLIVTNVPGPEQPLSLLGAKLTRIVPIVNLWPHQSLGVAVASYAGDMTFGIHTDRAVIPDIDVLRDDLAAAFDELRAAVPRVSKAPDINATTTRDLTSARLPPEAR
jgi:WS/DGAT/MGAT family acyltransferase